MGCFQRVSRLFGRVTLTKVNKSGPRKPNVYLSVEKKDLFSLLRGNEVELQTTLVARGGRVKWDGVQEV